MKLPDWSKKVDRARSNLYTMCIIFNLLGDCNILIYAHNIIQNAVNARKIQEK